LAYGKAGVWPRPLSVSISAALGEDNDRASPAPDDRFKDPELLSEVRRQVDDLRANAANDHQAL
jgi:hypothetical protein